MKRVAYLEIFPNWLPYALMKDKRGFVSKFFGNGHTGIDTVGNEWDNPICAVINGFVEKVYNDEKLGNVVIYGDGYVQIAHYHLAKVAVKVGDAVVKGETKIGIEGSTGTSSLGKHLHTSLWIGGFLTDPTEYFSGQKNFPKGGNFVEFKVGDKVKVVGVIAISAYSATATAKGNGRELEITKIYEGTNFPYQLGVTGFARSVDLVLANTNECISKEQYEELLEKYKSAENKIKKILEVIENENV